MADVQVSNVFVDGDVVSASNFNTNYSDIVSYINARNSGSSTWDAFNMTSTTNVATFNNSTGTQDIAQFKDNGTSVVSISDGGFVNLPYQDFSYSTPDAHTTSAPINQFLSFTISSQTHSSMDSDGTYTAVAAGKYLAMAQIQCTATSGDIVGNLYIRKNGSVISKCSYQSVLSGRTGCFFIADITALSVGDYLQIYYEELNATINTISGSNGYFIVQKLS